MKNLTKRETILLEALMQAKARLGCLQSYFVQETFTDRYGDRALNEDCLKKIDNAIKKTGA